ncbi:glutamate receptor 2.8-like [Argentina anserina]|uniref:glutamate receptor 2.8-like n=1 Tax=Argentina anserina TaxID=57926 RepID=UPI0021763AF6|nr:glutamate receptor 2.8-like [Potentilla anserina]
MKCHTNIFVVFVPYIFLVSLFSWIFVAMSSQNSTTEVKVGVILDFESGSAKNGKAYWSCMKVAHADFYAANPNFKTRLALLPRNSNRTVVGAAAAAVDLINKEEVQAIIGPETSMEANFVVSVGNQTKVPILTFSASSPALTTLGSSFFFRLTQNDSIQVKAIAGIVQNFGWRKVVPIYVDSSYGWGIVPFLIDALQEVEAHVPYRSVISEAATDDQIEIELYKLMTMQTRVFIVHMNHDLCSKLFAKAKKIGMMSAGYVWITTGGISNSLRSMSYSDRNSMEGVLGIQTEFRRTLKHKEFGKRSKMKFQQDNPNITNVELDVYGFQARDAVFALASAVERVGYSSIGYQLVSDSSKARDLDTLKVSQYGSKLAKALSDTRFKGLAGDFNVIDGELQSSSYMIINVIGGKARGIALWTPENGMVSTDTGKISTDSQCMFGPIKWPGASYAVPKGWEIPTNQKKLRIGVPVKDGFTEFVKITKDPNTNRTAVTGFCIDVFNAAVELLPYALPYEFIPFENSSGLMDGSYDDLIYQVYLKKFDAVVGDTTIRANRSLYVDFTMPYTETDVGMVVPIRNSKSKNAWIFMKPLTSGLWLTTLSFFIVIAFVVWVLEHRVNEDFRGPPSRQVGTSFWFSFSTMVFSHRERVVSNLARPVMTIWVFVVLIVTSSYTANLSSLLTIQQLQPTVTDLNDLLKNGDNVGYSKSSFVYDVLIQRGFNDSRLIKINLVEDGDKELTKGTANGGIAAYVGESPGLEVFISKYCSKYIMVGPISKTNGVAFVFPKRSPLVADMSRAILNVTEGKKIMKIQAYWLKKESNCQGSSSDNNISDRSLGLDSFCGLFIIAGVSSLFTLFIFFTSFVYKHMHVFRPAADSEASAWSRMRAIFKTFDDRDASFYTSSSSQQSKKTIGVGDLGLNASPTSNWSESPVSYTNHGDLCDILRSGQTPTRGASPQPVQTIELAITC